MNVTEGNAVNTLLDWLLAVGDLDQDETAGQAADAAAYLAGRANRALHAGLTEAQVREAWPSPRERVDDDAEDDRSDEQWCVFSGNVDDVVRVVDDLAEAEELAQVVIDAGIAWRVVTSGPWEVLPRCAGCGSVLDGALCCDAQRPAPQVDEVPAPNAGSES